MKIKRISDKFARNFKLRILHLSDTHGHLPRLYGRFDVVLHTGDLFPNSHHVMTGDKNREMAFQLQWLRDEMPNFKKQLNGHPFIYVPGNHDMCHSALMEFELRQEDIEAFDITDKIFSFQDVKFFGFPYVPYISGIWNYEREIPEMQQEVKKLVTACNAEYIDVLACHAPIHKCLDLSMGNEILGSTVIADALDYKISEGMQPSHYLCGHIHEAHGMALRNGMLVSNAATTQQIIEV
jgi:Icc-related predicted phosphoesterase